MRAARADRATQRARVRVVLRADRAAQPMRVVRRLVALVMARPVTQARARVVLVKARARAQRVTRARPVMRDRAAAATRARPVMRDRAAAATRAAQARDRAAMVAQVLRARVMVAAARVVPVAPVVMEAVAQVVPVARVATAVVVRAAMEAAAMEAAAAMAVAAAERSNAMSIAPEVEALTASVTTTERGLVFSDAALETCRQTLAALDATALASRMTDLLAIALELLTKEPTRGQPAAHQLCELCATLQGRAKSASDLFADLARANDRTAQLLGRAPSAPRAPKLDAPAPNGTLKLSSLKPPAKRIR